MPQITLRSHCSFPVRVRVQAALGGQVPQRLQAKPHQRRPGVPLIGENPIFLDVKPARGGVVAQRCEPGADRLVLRLPGAGHPRVRCRRPPAVPRQHGGRRHAPLHRQLSHLAGRSPWARDRNSSRACAATEEIVRPDARACSRAAAASRTGSRTVNTSPASPRPRIPLASPRSNSHQPARPGRDTCPQVVATPWSRAPGK